MKFVTLHGPSGDEVHMRSDAIIRVMRDGAHTRVDLSCGLQLVIEKPDDVMAAIEQVEK